MGQLASSRITTLHSRWRWARAAWFYLAAVWLIPGEARAQEAASTSEAGADEAPKEKDLVARFCRKGFARDRAAALVRTGRARVDAASVLPNPNLVLEHNQSFVEGETWDRETVVGVEVPLGIGGRRFLLDDAARERRVEQEAAGHALLVDKALDLREALVRARASARRAAVLREGQARLEKLSSTLGRLAKAGDSSQYDHARQTLEEQTHADRLALASSRAKSDKTALTYYLDGRLDVESLDIQALLSASPSKGAGPPTPRVQSLDASIRAADIEIEAANRRWVPDLDVFLGYRNVLAGDLDGHGFSLRLTLPLTFFDHGQGEAATLAAARSQSKAERAEIVRYEKAVGVASAEALDELDERAASADVRVKLARDLEVATTKLYAAGEASITELLTAVGRTEEALLSAIDVEETRALTQINRMRAAGSLFDSGLDAACAVRGTKR